MATSRWYTFNKKKKTLPGNSNITGFWFKTLVLIVKTRLYVDNPSQLNKSSPFSVIGIGDTCCIIGYKECLRTFDLVAVVVVVVLFINSVITALNLICTNVYNDILAMHLNVINTSVMPF